MAQIINPFRKSISPSAQKDAYYSLSEDDVVYQVGDYKIYRHGYQSYVYVYKNYAFNELAGLNKTHLKAVAERNGEGFLYERALETLSRMEEFEPKERPLIEGIPYEMWEEDVAKQTFANFTLFPTKVTHDVADVVRAKRALNKKYLTGKISVVWQE